MGAWGVGLYDNDDALDIKEAYKDMLTNGKTPEEAGKIIIKDYGWMLNDPETEPIFWFTLADMQWKMGIMTEDVRDRAISWIDSGKDQEFWKVTSPKTLKKRIEKLEELRRKLLSPMPKAKKIAQRKLYCFEWNLNLGDITAHPFESEYALQNGYAGRYFYIQKLGDKVYTPYRFPIVGVKISMSKQEPNMEEWQRLSNIIIWPKKIAGETVESVAIQVTSKRTAPKKLTFIGNSPVDISINDRDEERKNHPYNGYKYTSFMWYMLEEQMIGCFNRNGTV